MKFLPDSDERAYRKARKRLERVRGPEVHAWADTTLWAIQEGLDGGRDLDRAALQQARTGTVSLLAALDTLLDSSR